MRNILEFTASVTPLAVMACVFGYLFYQINIHVAHLLALGG